MRRLDAFSIYMIIGAAGALFQSMVFTVLAVYYVLTVGMNPLQLVLVGTTIELTVFVFEVPTGVVADMYSRRLSVIMGYVLVGVCYLIEGWAPLFAAILMAEFIRGIGETFISGAETAWITDELGAEHVSRAFVRHQQFRLAGGFLGILLGSGLGALQLNLPVWIGGACLVGLGVFLLAVMPERGFTPAPDPNRETWHTMLDTTRAGLRVVRIQPVVLMFVLVAVVYGAFSEGFDRLWEAQYLNNIGFPAAPDVPAVVWIGVINAGSMLVGIGVSELLVRRLNFDNMKAMSRTLLVTTALLMVTVVAFGAARGFIFATVAFWLARGLRALQFPVAQTWMNRNIPSHVRATVLSLASQADAFGQIAGGPVVGAVGLRSLRAAMAMSGLLLAPALYLYGKGVRLADDETPADG